MFCPFCGNKIDDDATFCPYCGANLSSVSETKIPIESVHEAPSSQVPASPPVSSSVSPYPPQEILVSRKRTWVIYYTFVVLGLIGIFVLISGLYMVIRATDIVKDEAMMGNFNLTNSNFTQEQLVGLIRMVGYIFLALGVLDLVAAIGTFQLKRWGRNLAIVMFVITFLRPSFDIILGIIGLYGLIFHKETKRLFSA